MKVSLEWHWLVIFQNKIAFYSDGIIISSLISVGSDRKIENTHLVIILGKI